MEFYSRTKQRPMLRRYMTGKYIVLSHLSMLEGNILCGIDKRHPDIYNIGDGPIEDVESNRVYICKKCFSIWEKLNKKKLNHG